MSVVRPLFSTSPATQLAASWRGGIVAVVVLSGAVVGLLPPIYGVLLVGVIAVGLIALVQPRLPVYLLGLAAPLASAREVRVGGFGVSAAEVLVAMALLAAALAILAGHDRLRLSPWLVPIALFLCIALLTMSRANSLPAAAKEMLRWIELGAATLLVVALVRRPAQARVLLAVIFVGVLAEAALGAIQFALQIGPPSFAVGRFLRAYGTFGQPNPYAGYLSLTLPVALALAWSALDLRRGASSQSGLRRLVWLLFVIAALAASGIGMAMSLSRGAWLGAAIGLAVLLMAAGRRTFLAVTLGFFVLILVAFLGAFDVLPASLVARAGSITSYFGVFDVRTIRLTPENWAIVERMAHWQAAIDMWQRWPWLGGGIGQYAVLYPRFSLPGWDDPLGHAHNYYLNIAAETGTIGLIGYLVMVGSWLLLAFRLTRGQRHPLARALGLGVLGALTASAVHNLFDNLYVAGLNVHVGLLVGLAATASTWKRSTGDDDATAC